MPQSVFDDENQAVDPYNAAEAVERERLSRATGGFGKDEDKTSNDSTSSEHPSKNGQSGSAGDKASGSSGFYTGSGADTSGVATGILAGAAGGAGGVLAGGLSKTLHFLWGSRRRKQASIGAGTIGVVVGGLTLVTTVISGSEAIHISQFLQQAHFSSQQDAGDERMGRLYRWMRSGGDVGETRVSYLGSKYKTTMIADMEKVGLKPVFSDGQTVFRGYTIDTTNERSPYRGMSEEQVKKKLESKGVKSGISVENGKVTVSAKGYFQQRKAMRTLVKDTGYSKITSSLRIRVLSKYGLVTWHPLQRLEANTKEKIAEKYKTWKEERNERYKTGTEATKIDGSGASTESQGEDGETTQNPVSDEEKAAAGSVADDAGKISSILKSKTGVAAVSVAGGAAAIQGVVCGLYTIAENIDETRDDQVNKPLTRMGMDAITTGEQQMAGVDIDTDVLGFAAKSYDGVDKTTGKQTSWYDAKSVRAEANGKNEGYEASDTIRGIGEGVPSWLAWTQNNPTIDATCSTAGQLIGGGISVTLGVITGGIASTVIGVITSATLAPKAMDAAADFLAGNAVNVDAAGAEWGNNINFGSRMGANTAALQFGGTALSEDEELALKQSSNEEYQAEFNSKSLAYRLFNPDDGRTATAKLIDRSSELKNTTIATIVSSTVDGLGSLTKLPSTIFGSKAKAADTYVYDYGFKKYGFSEEDQSNPLVADPYQNAEATAKILSGPSGQEYIDRAKTCFGLSIEQVPADDGTSKWGVVSADGAINIYSKDYESHDCRDVGNDDWLRVRFFVFDTGIMEGYACFQGDETSCKNNGVILNNDATENPGTKVRVASFNVWGASHKMSNWKDRMDRSIKVIQNNDIQVVGLQEFQPIQRKYFLEQVGDEYDIYPKSGDFDRYSDNSIVWKKSDFTFVEGNIIPNVKYFNDSKLLAPYVKLKSAEGQEFYMLNTHDPAHEPQDGPQYANSPYHRWQNAVQYAKFIDSLQKENNIPVMMTGDFNSGYSLRTDGNTTYQHNPQYLSYCVLAVNGPMDDAYDLFEKRPEKCPNPGNFNAVDHVFVSKGLKVDKYFRLDKNGSDVHDTHIADVVIGGGDSSSDEFVVGSYNLKHEIRHGGSCKENACAEERSQKQANIILGKAGNNPAFDILGTQETAIPQHERFMTMLTGYDFFPAKGDLPKTNGNALYWNRSKFTLVDKGTIRTLNNSGNPFDRPWVGLESSSGKKVYVMSVHAPIDRLGGASARTKIARDTYDWAKSVASKADMIFIVGDFNERLSAAGNDTIYCVLTQPVGGKPFLQNAQDMQNGETPTKACPKKRDSTIDQIYLSVKEDVSVSDWTHASRSAPYGSASDHSPTYVTVHAGKPDGEGGAGSPQPGEGFVGAEGFPGGSCVAYVKHILAKHSSRYRGGSLGNGRDVARNLGALGYTVNNTPAVHATVSFPGGPRGSGLGNATYGHVAIVSKINRDGSIVVEESNWIGGVYGTHTVPASIVGKLTYAHTEVGWR